MTDPKMPRALEDLILDAAKEGFQIRVMRHQMLAGAGWSTMVRITHPKGNVHWVESGFPDFFDPETLRTAFEGHKFFALHGYHEGREERSCRLG